MFKTHANDDHACLYVNTLEISMSDLCKSLPVSMVMNGRCMGPYARD